MEKYFRKFLFLELAGINVLLFGVFAPISLAIRHLINQSLFNPAYFTDVVLYQLAGGATIFLVYLVYGYIFRMFRRKIKPEPDISHDDSVTETFPFDGNLILTALRFVGFVMLVTLGAFVVYFIVTQMFSKYLVISLGLLIALSYPFFRVIKL